MSLCQSGFHSIDDFASLSDIEIDTPSVCWFSSRHRVHRSFLHHSWSHLSCFTYVDYVHSVSVHLLYDLSHRPFSRLDTWWVHSSSQLWFSHIGSATWIALFLRAATSLVSDVGFFCFFFRGGVYGQPPTWSARVSFVWLSHLDQSSMVDPAGGRKAPPWHTSRQTTTPTTR